MKMGEASKRRDVDGRNEAYWELQAAAEEGQLLEVMAACDAMNAALDAEDEDAWRRGIRALTVSVYNLKHQR